VRRAALSTFFLAAVFLMLAAPVSAGHRHRGHSGIAGTVLYTSCTEACPQPLRTSPPYTGGGLTVTVQRVSDGALVASLAPADGTFRVRTRRGWFDVTASVASSNPCGPVVTASRVICPAATMPVCGPSSDTARVRVRRHRFTRVELHVQDPCVLTPQ